MDAATCDNVMRNGQNLVPAADKMKTWSSRKSLVRLVVGGLLAAAVFIPTDQGHAQDVSISFLREICFLKPWQDYLHEYGEPEREDSRPRGSSVRLRIQNPSWHYDARICVYDKICRVVRYRGLLRPGRNLRIEACANSRRRGSIIVLEAFGEALLYDNVSSGTINLPYDRSRR